MTRQYDRMAFLYDIYDAPMEMMGTRRRRRRLVSCASGRVLEVGVGTGRNFEHYPAGVDVVGIDASRNMLARARRRAVEAAVPIHLERADVMRLPFADGAFDTVVATCVFCSVADPIAGLREIGRVVKPGGHILLLEHVRPRGRVLGLLSDLVSIFTRRIFGFNANRRTEDNVMAAGLRVRRVRRNGIWREIEATPSDQSGGRS